MLRGPWRSGRVLRLRTAHLSLRCRNAPRAAHSRESLHRRTLACALRTLLARLARKFRVQIRRSGASPLREGVHRPHPHHFCHPALAFRSFVAAATPFRPACALFLPPPLPLWLVRQATWLVGPLQRFDLLPSTYFSKEVYVGFCFLNLPSIPGYHRDTRENHAT